MPIPKHLILDLDDTILDYTAPGAEVWLRLYERFAPRMNIPAETLQRAVKSSIRWYWSDPDRFREGRLDLPRARRVVVRDAFTKLGRTDVAIADELADAFTTEREIVIRPFDGAIEALGILRRSGSRMVMLTNGQSAFQRAKIERFRLARFFDAIFVESEIGFGKPDPRAHRAALAALGADPPQAWMIGDNLEQDIRPAKELGMRTAWIHSPSEKPCPEADHTVSSLRSLLDLWDSAQPEEIARGA
jgi:HAD superfamily hydrolase (TIGR01549 family)